VVAQYILGDEHVEVEMRVDLLSVLPLVSASPLPVGDKSAKPAAKGGTK
jgi:hypothetical protein